MRDVRPTYSNCTVLCGGAPERPPLFASERAIPGEAFGAALIVVDFVHPHIVISFWFFEVGSGGHLGRRCAKTLKQNRSGGKSRPQQQALFPCPSKKENDG